MPHPTDYTNAHRRHWHDGEVLFHHKRWANADQLYGFSAECGLKAVMKALGMPVDAHGTPTNKQHKQHVQHLWPIFLTFAQSRQGARYASRISRQNTFSNWSHHDRYSNTTHFNSATTSIHRSSASSVYSMVILAIQDGLVS